MGVQVGESFDPSAAKVQYSDPSPPARETLPPSVRLESEGFAKFMMNDM